LIDGISGLFVGFPSQKDQDGEYRDTIWAEKELKDKVIEVAMRHYEQDVVSSDAMDDEVIPF
jgi:DNA-binding cell septation regulator SpoVG